MIKFFTGISSGSRTVITAESQQRQNTAFSDFDTFEWQCIAKNRLQDLIRLREGWDGYEGFPVSFETAMFAYEVLGSICAPDSPAPQIVPGSSGDLQLEWHLDRGDLELWVKAPNNVHAWFFSADTGEDAEVDLTTNFQIAAQWLRDITTEPTIAIAAAA
jgi:hypothetical protein